MGGTTLNEQRHPIDARSTLRILIADDHPLLLAGIRTALEADGGFDIVGETSAGPRLLPLVGQVVPDVVLMSSRMPRIDAVDTLERIRLRHPHVKVIFCSAVADHEAIAAAFAHGACGYVVKTIESEDLGAAIRQAVAGSAYHVVGHPADADAPGREAGLTGREVEIVRAVARGLPNKAVGKELWITEQTVKFHLSNVYRKLGISNRAEAVRWAIRRGLDDRSPIEA